MALGIHRLLIEQNEPNSRTVPHTYLKKVLLSHLQGSIEEVQHITRVLDAVLSCLLWGGEPIVP